MEAHALALELRDGFVQLISLFFLGLSKANMGRMSEALAALTEALALAQRNGDHFFLPRLPNCIGWIYRELQDFDRAFKYDLQGVEIARADDVAEAEANSLINLGYTIPTREKLSRRGLRFVPWKPVSPAMIGIAGVITSACSLAPQSIGWLRAKLVKLKRTRSGGSKRRLVTA
jgi:tetratricopeptide (TPR) repeat protein